MTEKYKSIVSKKLFLGFCITELLILVILKVIQTIYPYSFIEVLPMFSAILLNALFMLLLVIRVKNTGKVTEIKGIPLAVFTTLLADCFLVLLHGIIFLSALLFILDFPVKKIDWTKPFSRSR